jgi:pimeloyl-ACP methyl ester carboxylesterase
MLSEDDLVLPADVAERMVREIPNAKKVDVEGSNHYSILFQPNPMRDKVLLGFLE